MVLTLCFGSVGRSSFPISRRKTIIPCSAASLYVSKLLQSHCFWDVTHIFPTPHTFLLLSQIELALNRSLSLISCKNHNLNVSPPNRAKYLQWLAKNSFIIKKCQSLADLFFLRLSAPSKKNISQFHFVFSTFHSSWWHHCCNSYLYSPTLCSNVS